MSNRVTIELTAKDNASGVFKNLDNSIRDNVLSANLLSSAITSGMGLASSAVGSLNKMFQDSQKLTTKIVSMSDVLSSASGMSLETSQDITESLLAQSEVWGSELIGGADDYRSAILAIMDDVIGLNKEVNNGVVNVSQLQSQMTDLGKGFGFLTAQADLDNSALQEFTAKLFGGSTFTEARTLRFFEQNSPAFRKAYQELVEASGVKRLTDLTAEQQLEFLKELKNKSQVGLKAQEKLSQMASSAIEQFQTNLFGQFTGVFGLKRDVFKNISGKQTIEDAISQGVIALIGDNGLLTSLGNLFSKITGLNLGDAGQWLYSGIVSLNSYIKSTADFVNKITSQISGDSIGDRIGQMYESVVSFITGFNPSAFGAMLANGFNTIASIALSITPYVINAAVKVSNWLFDSIPGFLSSINWSGIFVGLGNVLVGLDWGAIGLLAVKVIGGAILLGVGAFALSFIAPIGTVLIAAGVGIAAVVSAEWSEITGFISQKFSEMGSFISENFTTIVSFAFPMFGVLLAGFQTIKNIIDSNMGNIKNLADIALGGISRVFDFIMGFVNNIISRIPGVGTPSQTRVANNALGYIPNGLFKAAIKESRLMPTGANVVVANDSEAILTTQMQSALAKRLTTPSGASLTINNLNISSQASNTQAIAREVISAIESEWEKSKLTFATPNFA